MAIFKPGNERNRKQKNKNKRKRKKKKAKTRHETEEMKETVENYNYPLIGPYYMYSCSLPPPQVESSGVAS